LRRRLKADSDVDEVTLDGRQRMPLTLENTLVLFKQACGC